MDTSYDNRKVKGISERALISVYPLLLYVLSNTAGLQTHDTYHTNSIDSIDTILVVGLHQIIRVTRPTGY